MKLAIVLLVLLPLAFAVPQKRFILSTFGLDANVLRNTVQDLLDLIGADGTEELCEDQCHELIMGPGTYLIHTLCSPICKSFQTLVRLFDLRPQTRALL